MALNLTIKQGSENYTATIVEIKNIFPIEGADKIVRTNVEGNDVIISKDEKIGTKMIYFVSGTKLNPDFCKYNNLLTDKEQNNDKTKTGYISHKQFRVKAIKLKGVISDGILLPLLSLAPILGPGINLNRLEIGNTFTDIDNIPICEKYIVPVARNSNPGDKVPKIARFNRILDNQFQFHNSTENLRKNIHKLNPNDIIGIHYKKHGCVSEDALIETLEHGIKTIKEIVDTKLNCRIKAYDTLEKEIVYVPIDQYYYKKDDGDWYEIELENGMKIEITSNNPVWLPKLNCYREVKDLEISDFLLIN